MKRLWLGILVLGVTVNSQPLFAREEITGFNQIILAQTPSPPPTKKPSPSPTSTTKPSPPPKSDQTLQPRNSGNSVWMFLFFLQGVVFLVFKGFEVFYYEKKMASYLDNLGKQINQLVSIPEEIKSLTLEVKELKSQSETNTNAIEKKLNEKLPDPLEIEAISQQISSDLNQLIERILREKLDQQFSVMIPLIVQQILENPQFIESLSQLVADKINTNPSSVVLSQTVETAKVLELPSLPENPMIQEQEDEDSQDPELTDEETEIVEKYNNRKLSLTKDLIIVKTSKDTILDGRSGRESLATLIASSQGSYWVIKGERNDHYLVPNYDKIFNTQKMRTLGTIFELRNYEPEVSNTNRFQLRKPAKVSVITAGEQWVLIENGQGILDFQ